MKTAKQMQYTFVCDDEEAKILVEALALYGDSNGNPVALQMWNDVRALVKSQKTVS